MQLRWRLVVVTGAGAGLGREIALRFARAGAGVLAVDRDLAAADETAALVRACRVTSWSLQADLCSEEEVALVAARALDLGGADVLVNNAGGWTPGEQYPRAPAAGWSATLDLNLRAPMLLTQHFLDGIDRRPGRATEPGAVVNVASSAGLGRAGYGSPEYAAAKAGLVRFTTAMATPEIAGRARVTCVVPDWVGLPRAERQWARLSPEEQAGLPPLIAPREVTGVVLELAERGAAGTVVELWGGRPPVWSVPGTD